MSVIFHRLTCAAALVLLVTACAETVSLPKPGPLAETTPKEAAVPAPAVAEPIPPKPVADGFVATLPGVGEKTLHEVVMTKGLLESQQAVSAGDPDRALATLDRETAGASDPLYAWYLSLYRAHALNLAGRAPEAEEEAARTSALEIALRGTDLVARTLRGDAKTRLGDFDGAERDYVSVISALGGWQFPTSYSGFPTNMRDLAITTEAKMRATLGMAFTNTMAGRYDRALPWTADLERQIKDLIYVKNHPLYGSALGAFHPDIYLARAVNLTFIGAIKVGRGGSMAEAEPFFTAALQNFAAIRFRQGEAYVETFKAKALLDSGRQDEAEKQADVALAKAREQRLFDFIWRIQALAAEALYRDGDFDKAEKRYLEAQQSVDTMTGLLGSDRNKRRFGVGKDDVTRRLAGLAFRRRDAGALLGYMERGRARAFVDMLAGVAVAGSETDADAVAVRDLDRRVQASVLVQELGRGEADRGAAISEADLRKLADERGTRIARLRQSSPDLADALAVDVPDFDDIRARLGDGEALVYALPAGEDDALRLLTVRPGGAALLALATGREAFSELVENFMIAVEDQDTKGQMRGASALAAALEIDKWQAPNGIYVVPSGDFYFIPWGALDVQTPVAVLPTAAWLLRGAGDAGASTKAVVVGDPDFKGELEQLPGAKREAGTVAGFYGAAAISGAAATEKGVRDAVGVGVDVLHLATHGIFDAAQPLRSAVFLSGDKGAHRLTAQALYERPLPTRIVVLSACETGVGRVSASDDYLGLPRSFFLGGAVSVLSSLWPVEDQGTAIFMETFHREARNGDYGDAWLKARDAVKAAGLPPWIYGAFVLSGGRRG